MRQSQIAEINNKQVSVLRYPGGKTRAVDNIFQYIPKDTRTICSPFLGGGSVELRCANNGMRVKAYDAFEPLVAFWNYLLKRPITLARHVAAWWSSGEDGLYTTTGPEYSALQKSVVAEKNKIQRAALYYVINRTSYSGSTLSGGRTPGNPRFTESSLTRLLDFRNYNLTKKITVECLDFRKAIKKNKSTMFYLDPPYWIQNKLYGVKGDMHIQEDDHMELYEILSKTKKWILSYNDSKKIRNVYSDYKIIPLKWGYGMKNVSKNNEGKKSMKKSSEVLILSHEISKYHEKK